MTDTLTAIGGALGVLAVLVVLLRGLAAWGRRLAAGPPHDTTPPPAGPAPAASPVVAPVGWLSADEEDTQGWAIETTAADVRRLDAIEDRLFGHRLRVLFERSLRQLDLTPAERDFARMRAGARPAEDGRR